MRRTTEQIIAIVDGVGRVAEWGHTPEAFYFLFTARPGEVLKIPREDSGPIAWIAEEGVR
jgi:hypothetical protein